MKTVFRILLRVLILCVVVAALAVAVRTIVTRKRASLASAPTYGLRPLPVQVAVVVETPLEQTLDYLSVLEPIREANVSARLTAVINEVRVDEGVPVRKGAVLITLDDREIREDIAATESQIAQAEADLAANEATVQALVQSVAYWNNEEKRDQKLAAEETIPAARAEATSDKANESRGKLAAAKKKSTALRHLVDSRRQGKAAQMVKLSYCTITSPYDGGIRYRRVDPGDLATPGKALLVVADRSGLKLAFDIPQGDLSDVREGQTVRIRVQDRVREVKLTHLYPSLNAARMLRAEATLPPSARDGLACGQYVPISVVIARHGKMPHVPASSVIEMAGKPPCVYLVKEGRLHRVPIRIVGSNGDRVAVEGVAPGDRVVTTSFLGWARLADGMPVEAVE